MAHTSKKSYDSGAMPERPANFPLLRCAMRAVRFPLLLTIFLFAATAWPQNTKIQIPAGTPEDKELTAIASETDTQRRIALYDEFVKKYASNKAAAAYGDWQLAQQYLAAGDAAKALESGDKALELYPNDLDIIVSQIGVAQAMKDNARVVDYAVRGAAIYNSIASQPKPADVPEADWKTQVADEQESARSSYEYVETAAYNVIAGEQDAAKRMTYIEKFTPAFPKSKFEEQVSQLALYSLQQLNQPERLEAYGEKTLAANPNSVPTLLMLANAYSEDPKHAADAITCANKVIALTASANDSKQKLATGVAHSTLGYVYLKQDKYPAAVAELKTAAGMLQEDPQAQQAALFRLGFAYAKQNRRADSIAALQKAAAMPGPYQAPAKEMLAKVSRVGK
jgi:tetratricopeptide (TPR) repeat protein